MSTRSRFQSTREAVFQWAARADGNTLRAGVDRFLGTLPRDADTVGNAIAFALQAPDPEGRAPWERYAAAHPSLPRVQRDALAAWAKGRFGLFEVRGVKRGVGFTLRDIVADRVFDVREKAATDQLAEGDWLFAMIVPNEGALELEGTLGLLVEHAREPVLAAVLAAYDGARDVDAAMSRRAMWPLVEATHAAMLAADEGEGESDEE